MNEERQALHDLLVAPYRSPEARQYAVTIACLLLGHPARHDKPPDLKQDYERGCVCGRQAMA